MLDPFSGSHDRDRWKQFGFLVADLFLVLALLFLLMTISAQSEVSALKKQLSMLTPTPMTALTPTPLPRLTRKAVVLTLTVDWNELLIGSQSASANVIQQIQGDKDLQQRRAGLVIAYGGTLDVAGIKTAEQVADKVDAVLQSLSGPGQLFEGTVYHDSLFLLGHDHNYVKLEVYLYEVD